MEEILKLQNSDNGADLKAWTSDQISLYKGKR